MEWTCEEEGRFEVDTERAMGKEDLERDWLKDDLGFMDFFFWLESEDDVEDGSKEGVDDGMILEGMDCSFWRTLFINQESGK